MWRLNQLLRGFRFRFVPLLLVALLFIRSISTILSMKHDVCPALPVELHNKRIVLASILRDAATVFPDWRKSTIAFVDCGIKGGLNHVTVSIWSNDNSDSTSSELNLLLRDLKNLGYLDRVSFVIESEGFLDESIKNAERIAKLAHIRNIAVDQVSDSMSKADALVFVNDVLFRPKDIYRLLSNLFESRADTRRPMIACSLDFMYSFYDVWVARDLLGNHFSAFFPYINYPLSQRRRAVAGLSFEVASCWNGLIAMDAQLYVDNGMRFRAANNTAGECVPSSESLLINLDYWRTPGSQDRSIIVDPSIKVFYSRTHSVVVAITQPFIEWTVWFIVALPDFIHGTMESGRQFPDPASLVSMTCTEMPDWSTRGRIGTLAGVATTSFILVAIYGLLRRRPKCKH